MPQIAPPPWNILFVITTSDFGGSESFLELLTARLDRSRFLPIVCSLCSPGRAAERIASREIEVLSPHMSPQPRLLEILKGVRWLADIIDKHSISLVHSILYRANSIAPVSARLSGRRPYVISNQHSLNPMGNSRLAAWSARLTRGLADHVLAVSEAVRRELVSREGLQPTRVGVVYSGVDSNLFKPKSKQHARAALGCCGDTPLIGGIGRFSPEKGFKFAVRAVDQLQQTGHAFKLLFVGDGVERPELEKMVRDLNLSDSIRFLGFRQDLAQILPAFDIVVIPSLEEGLPMLLLEAMACGCAVVASAVGGVPEVLEHRKSGLLTPPGSDSALTAAIGELLSDPGMRQALGNEARCRIERRFSLQVMVSSYELEYLSLLQRSPAREDGKALLDES